jgi:hypothetical protein
MGYYKITPELENMMSKYERIFHEEYPLEYLDSPENPDEHIRRVEGCIASKTPIPLSEYEHLLGCLM